MSRFCVPPLTRPTTCTLPRVLPVTLNWDAFYMFDSHPAPLLIARGPSLCVSQCLVDLGRGEAWALGLQFPARVRPSVCGLCARLHSPSGEVHVSSASVWSLGTCSSAHLGTWESGVGVQGNRNSGGERNLGSPSPGSYPLLLLFWMSGAPSSLRLCSWQTSRAEAGALATAGNLPGHFCARGGLW